MMPPFPCVHINAAVTANEDSDKLIYRVVSLSTRTVDGCDNGELLAHVIPRMVDDLNKAAYRNGLTFDWRDVGWRTFRDHEEWFE